jgi:large subunit ribosomal protein L13
MKTYSPKPADVERRWYVVDADGAVLGRLASEVAKILRGKHKPIFAPHADTGDHVIVVNAGGVRVTGGKEQKKIYYRHSGYPGGLREIGYDRLLSERPVLAVEKAVKGMLPKNSLGRKMIGKLAVYEGAEHPHQAQKPEPLALGQIPPWNGLPKPAPKPEPAPQAERAPKAEKPAASASTAKRSTAKAKTTTAKPATAKGATAKRATAKGATAKSAAKARSKPVADPKAEGARSRSRRSKATKTETEES